MKRSLSLLSILLLTLPVLAQQDEKPTAGLKTRPMQSTAAAPEDAKTTEIVAPALEIPTGTAVKMKLETTLSTMTNKSGDSFSGRVTEPVMLDGKTVIPVGASIQGHVTKVTEPRRYQGRPTIGMHPETMTLPNGNVLSFSAIVVDTHHANKTDVDDEGQVKGPGHNGTDLIEMAAGTAGGATIGGLAGGGKGALVGAAIGGGAAVVHWMFKRKSATLPSGSEIVMEIASPMRLSAAGGASQ